MIRVEALWLSAEPLDMRAGTETILARVVQVFGAAKPHHGYLFANRRLNQGRFHWRSGSGTLSLTRAQLDALILGLPWERLADGSVIRIQTCGACAHLPPSPIQDRNCLEH